jgi:hypothetical protein
VQTLSVTGKLDAGTADAVARSTILAEGGEGASVRRRGSAATAAPGSRAPKQQVQLPFRMELKRPRKSRLEIDFAGKTAVQVYDGQKAGSSGPISIATTWSRLPRRKRRQTRSRVTWTDRCSTMRRRGRYLEEVEPVKSRRL